MNNHFKCIGIVGHPRHPTALTTRTATEECENWHARGDWATS